MKALVSRSSKIARFGPVVLAVMLLAGCPQNAGVELSTDGLSAPDVGGSQSGSRDSGSGTGSTGSGQSGAGADSTLPDSTGSGSGSQTPPGDPFVFVDDPVLAAIPAAPIPTLPSGALRIVALGDSLTEGIGDTSGAGGGYPRRLVESVTQARGGSTILNLGKSGWTSTELIEGQGGEPNQIDAAVAAAPDIACLWIGSNDLFQLYEYGPETGTTRDLEAQDLLNFAANIDTLLTRLKQNGAALYVALHDDQSLRPVLDDRATLPFTTAQERAQMSRQVIRYNNVLIAAAQRHGATVIDFYHTTIFTSEATLDYDGIHPNTAGYDQIAEMWYAAMVPALTR